MSTDLDIKITPTRYTVSALPEDDINASTWSITVEYRGRGKWAVMHHGYCLGLGEDGNLDWDYEPSPSNRDDDWLERHRFALETAQKLARVNLPNLQINGLSVADVLARKAARQVEGSA